MDLDLSNPPARARKGPECQITIVAREHGEETARKIMAAIFDPAWPARALAETLTEQGIPGFTGNLIGHHKRGGCVSCRQAGRYPS